MKTALRLLLAPYRFSVDRLFRMGEIGGAHWFTDPNLLYRRRNQLTYTRDFSNAAWVKARASVTTDATTAPDGTSTADKLVEDATASNTHQIGQAYTIGAGTPVVMSVYAKASERTWVRLTANSAAGTDASAYFNLGAGTVGTVGGGSATITAVGNGWYRCSVAGTTSTANPTPLILMASGDGGQSYTGDGVSGLFLWGAQLEFFASSPTEYQDVPTTWPEAYLAAVGAENIFAWVDNAGTTPVTAVGDTIGLSLDRAYGGRTDGSLIASGATGLTGTATAASYDTSTGAGSVSRAGDASNQSWVTWTGLTTSAIHRIRVTNTGATSLDVRNGSVSGTIVASIAAGATSYVHPLTSGGSTSITITATNNSTTATFTVLEFCRVPGTHLIQATGTARPTLSARVNLLLNTATMSTQNVTTIAASYRLRFDGTGTVTLSGTATAGPLSAGTHSVTATAGTLTLTVSGSVTSADFRTADDAAKNIPAYQRVGATAADHDTDGFPHYALADGTDDCWASVSTVDGSAHDKISFVVAVTKLVDAASIVLEHGPVVASTTGTFGLRAASTTGTTADSYAVEVRGSSARQWRGVNGFAAPITSVVASQPDLTSNSAYSGLSVRVNGITPTQVGIDPTAPGGGNYSAQTLYVLSRAGTSLRFNGRIYSLVFRFGAMSDTDRNRLEQWTKNLMRLP